MPVEDTQDRMQLRRSWCCMGATPEVAGNEGFPSYFGGGGDQVSHITESKGIG